MTTNSATPKRRMSSALRRQSILQASISLFAQKGFHGASTKELAAVAGISEALLFRHFKSKEILYQEIQQSLLEPETDILERFEKLPLAVFSLVLIHLHLLQRLFTLTLKQEEDSLSDTASHSRKLLLSCLLDDAQFAATYETLHLKPLLPILTNQLQFLTKIGELKKSPLQPVEVLSYSHQLALGHLFASLQPSTLFTDDQSFKKQNRNVMRFMLLGCGMTRKQIRMLNWDELSKAYRKLLK